MKLKQLLNVLLYAETWINWCTY